MITTLQQFFANEALWCKGYLVEGHARCILGACLRVYPNDFVRQQVQDKLKSLLPSRYGQSLMAFNDAEETTFGDVRRLIEKAKV